MFLEITGFLAGNSEDSSIKFELNVSPELELAVMEFLGWQSLAAECDGERLLTNDQVREIASLINEPLPTELEMYIGVRA
ncbi:pyocin S6 family toxin immunity protein [Pseudomonas sp. D1HM]|uniref:pyocin S6 family toxin immunity protein n=1 Tax=Pseudomonas sp. D1HM TaxID=1784816 RepID=UPI00103E76F9|nr:pyocin S6 family toxin immunity protein [Pseudomonas sp. D1HM]MBW0237429.1 hypothetical protein [Pseudomonas sp. D1HM]